MKKILSIALVLCMLLSMAAAMSIPAAAIDGEWHILPNATNLQPEYEGEAASLAGYVYTDRGFHTIPTEGWKEGNPYVMAQTKEKVDLKQGVYLEIEIDAFSYSNDKWFNLNIWDSVSLSPGSGDPTFGSGVQTLIRPTNSPDAEDVSKPGIVANAEWYTKEFAKSGNSVFTPAGNKKTEDGHPIFCLTVTWNGSSYAVEINGGAAPASVINYMNEKWGGDDSEAYIGFWAKNSYKGGTVEYTITKFGTSKDKATTPMGDDSEPPINEAIPIAPMADPGTIPANKPGIFFNADRVNSDTKVKPATGGNGYSSVNDDFSLHVVSQATGVTAATYVTKNEVSYDIKDFPVAITLTRNFCTCDNEDGSCDAFEIAYYYLMYGDLLAPQSPTAVLEISYDSYTIEKEDGSKDTYLYFFTDFSKEFGEPIEGRINGIRIDVGGFDPNAEDQSKNTLDLMFTAFFRTVEEAEAYVLNYMEGLGWNGAGDTTGDTTTNPSEDTTETDTDTEITTDITTEVITDKGEQTTEKNEATTDAAEKPAESGCASVIGFSAAVVTIATGVCGILTFRKKRD